MTIIIINNFGSCVIPAEQHEAYSSLFSAALFLIIPHISDCSFYEQHCSFLVTLATFLRLKLSRGTIIAANIGQAMVNLKLWLR